MFALMLTNEGPDLSSQASKLWTLCEDFQQNVNAPPPTDVIAPCHGSTGSPSALSEEGSKKGRDGSRGGKGSS